MMESFSHYQRKAQEGLNNLEQFNNLEVILGNESCDLDSTVSTLMLGFYIYKCIEETDNLTLVLPIINVDEENFALRTENCYLLKKCNINVENLVFRNQVNLSAILNSKNVRTHLVDHHVLSSNDAILEGTIVQIFDHRPIDQSVLPLLEKLDLKIVEVGSCATLIANEILDKNETILCRNGGLLLYATIVYDTIALEPEKGRAKQLDIAIAEKLEEKFKFAKTRKELFDELWAAHSDVSHLTPKQLLYKDLKVVDGIPVPGLPMLFEDYIKLETAELCIKDFAKEHNSSIVVFIGLDAKQDVRRDISIYFDDADSLKDIFIDGLLYCKTTKGYDLDLSEINISVNNVKCFRQNNIKLTRKQIIPVLKDTIVQCKSL